MGIITDPLDSVYTTQNGDKGFVTEQQLTERASCDLRNF